MDTVSFVIDTVGGENQLRDSTVTVRNLRSRSIYSSAAKVNVIGSAEAEQENLGADPGSESSQNNDVPIIQLSSDSSSSDSDSEDELVEAAKIRTTMGHHSDSNTRPSNIKKSSSLDQTDTYINLTAYRETTNFKKKWKGRKKKEINANTNEKRKASALTRKNPNSDKVLKNSVITASGYLAKPDPPPYSLGERELKRRRKKLREKTKGQNWYHMPAPELTDEKKNDLLLIKWRDALDPKRFYKRSDMKGLPKYYQVGTVISDPVEYYSARVTKRERKATIVDELLADAQFKQQVKRRHLEIMEKRKMRGGGRKAYRHMKRLKKKKK